MELGLGLGLGKVRVRTWYKIRIRVNIRVRIRVRIGIKVRILFRIIIKKSINRNNLLNVTGNEGLPGVLAYQNKKFLASLNCFLLRYGAIRWNKAFTVIVVVRVKLTTLPPAAVLVWFITP